MTIRRAAIVASSGKIESEFAPAANHDPRTAT
jgi:hypothetical protein